MRFWSIRTTTSPFISQTQYNARGRVGTPMVRRRALPICWPLLVSRTGVRRNRPSPAVNSDEVVRVGAGSWDVSPHTDHTLSGRTGIAHWHSGWCSALLRRYEVGDAWAVITRRRWGAGRVG